MDTRNCCTGCAGVDEVYYCSNPIRRSTVVPLTTANPITVKPEIVKKEEKAVQGNAAPKATVTVKEEEAVKVNVR